VGIYVESSFALSIILTASLHCLAQTPSDTNQSNSFLTIRVRNAAEVSSGTLNRAIREAEGIFGQAGIPAKWLECGSTGTAPECQGLPGPMNIDLRIVVRTEAGSQGAVDSLFGLATPYEDGGVNAAVFYQHAQNFAKGGAASVAQILGHAMAHETGHLLLWSKSHSSIGIMKASWSRPDLRDIAMGHLAFTFQEAETIKGNIKTRARQQEYLTRSNQGTSDRRSVLGSADLAVQRSAAFKPEVLPTPKF